MKPKKTGKQVEIQAKDLKNDHLKPSIFSSRYLHRKTLCDAIENSISQFISQTQKETLVDMGCGDMPYKPIFEPYVKEYIGVDLPQNKHAARHFSLESKTGLPDGIGNVVLSTQVLEHVENPREYLEECHRVLSSEGFLILSTHGYWMYHSDPTDYWRWTSSGLKKILGESGFQILHFQGLMGLAPTGMQLFQDGVTPRIPNFLRPLFFLAVQFLMRVLNGMYSPESKNQDSCTYLLVASKLKS